MCLSLSCEEKRAPRPVSVINVHSLDRMLTAMKSNGEKFIDKTKKNSELKQIQLLLNNEPEIVFRITRYSCEVCVDSVLLHLDRFTSKYNIKDRVLILTDYIEPRGLFSFKKFKPVKGYDIINLEKGKLDLDADKQDEPYIFITDSSLQTKSLFIPTKSIPTIQKKYFEHLKNTYFD